MGRYQKLLYGNARRMTQNPTPAERIFADRLTAAGIYFEAQVVIGQYIVDFLFPQKMLIVELEGSIHNKQQEQDKKRADFLKSLGFKVKRLPNRMAPIWRIARLRRPAGKKSFAKVLNAKKTAQERLQERIALREQAIEVQALDAAYLRGIERDHQRSVKVIKKASRAVE